MKKISTQKFQSLIDLVDKSRQQEAVAVLEAILSRQQNAIIDDVETISENLHQSLDSFGSDSSIIKHAKLDLPDASERLEYVLEETKLASDKTISSAENLLAIIGNIESKVDDVASKEQLQQAQSEIIDIMTAQSFQDLTGQVLKRIIILVTVLEENLRELISSAGIDIESIHIEESAADKRQQEMKGVGPNATKSSQEDSLSSQADVDDLLGDLGL